MGIWIHLGRCACARRFKTSFEKSKGVDMSVTILNLYKCLIIIRVSISNLFKIIFKFLMSLISNSRRQVCHVRCVDWEGFQHWKLDVGLNMGVRCTVRSTMVCCASNASKCNVVLQMRQNAKWCFKFVFKTKNVETKNGSLFKKL